MSSEALRASDDIRSMLSTWDGSTWLNRSSPVPQRRTYTAWRAGYISAFTVVRFGIAVVVYEPWAHRHHFGDFGGNPHIGDVLEQLGQLR